MSAPTQPDYSGYVALASKITHYLAGHPHDAQAKADLHYVVSRMQGPSGATAAANTQDMANATGSNAPATPAAALSGIVQGALDIPRGALGTILHPIRAAGQATGIGNWEALAQTFRDPDASKAEKLTALVQATPLNMGYSAERRLLDATGATGDAGSTEEQFRAGTNVASLGLLGVNPKTALRLATKPVTALLGYAMDRLIAARQKAGGVPPVPPGSAPGPGVPLTPPVVPPAPVDWRIAALRERLKGAPESTIQQAIAGLDAPSGMAPSTPTQAAPDALRSLPDAALSPTPALMESAAAPGAQEAILARQGLLGNTPPPPSPGLLSPQVVANSYTDLRQFLRQGIPRERITINYWTRGGALEQTVPPVPQRAMAGSLSGAPYVDLQTSLQTATGQLKEAILKELQRRGIRGAGLLGSP